MSNLTNFAENKLVDMLRGQAWALGGSLYIGLASASSDSSVTELSGTGYARVPVTRNLTNWAGTQGPGTTLASSGTSHTSSNNILLDWGTSGSAWGTANYAVVFDATSSGNAICYLPLETSIVIGSAQPVSVAIASLAFSLGVSGGCTDYLANKLIDFIFRGQALAFANLLAGLFSSAPSNAGGGVELAGGGYMRVDITCNLTNWAGTQAPGSTTASTGTSGQTSNNAAIVFPTPSSSWGTIGWSGYYDGSNHLLFWAPLSAPKSIASGSPPPTFPIGAQTITFA